MIPAAAPETAALRDASPSREASPGAPSRWAGALAALVLLAAIGVGAWKGFPVADDGFDTILLKSGSGIARAHADRPVSGWLIERLAGSGLSRRPFVAAGVFFWALLAWQTGRLWRRLFPEFPSLAILAAALCLAPIAVETQFTTLETLVPANLPVSLVLAALLIAWRSAPRSLGSSALAAVLAAAAAAISEYGPVSAVGAVVLLIVLGRGLRGLPLVAGTAAGYLVFRLAGDATVRDAGDLGVHSTRLLATPWSVPFRIFTGTWYSLVGAYGRAADLLRPAWSSRSTILAFFVGVLVAGLLVLACRRASAEAAAVGARRPVALLAASVAALLAVQSQNTFLFLNGYESRLRLPALPFAVCLTVCAVRGFGPASRARAVALLGLVAGYATVLGAATVAREQRLLESLGNVLRPRLGAPSTTLVAVVPPLGGRLDDVELTAKATWLWPREDADRVWLMRPSTAAVELGDRMRCRDVPWIEIRNERFSRPRSRVAAAVYLPVDEDRVGEVEPYCISTGSGAREPAEAPRP